jgi:hypothetical protein
VTVSHFKKYDGYFGGSYLVLINDFHFDGLYGYLKKEDEIV